MDTRDGELPRTDAALRSEQVPKATVKAAQTFGIDNICTDRYVPLYDQPCLDLIFEWEDQISTAAGLPITSTRLYRKYHENIIARKLYKLPGAHTFSNSVGQWFGRGRKSLYITLRPQGKGGFSTRSNVIPIIIDFWKLDDLKSFFKNYSHCPLVMVSSPEVFSYLKNSACPLNLHCLPLSLPDKYRAVRDGSFNKQYDVVIAGRQNPVLMGYMERYAKERRDVEYLYQSMQGRNYTYISNKSGALGAYGTFNDRGAYWNLLKAAKVCFYSTQGMDGGDVRTGGFNPVTPRFLEILSAGCHVLARYPDNEDTAFFGLKEIGPSIESYAEFVAQLEAALESPPPIHKNCEYLKKHYTSSRLALLNQILSTCV